MPADPALLSKTISHALRHQPWLYELELDDEGWTDVAVLLDAMHRQHEEWRNLSEDDLREMIASSDKPRHEIQSGRIRAIGGQAAPGRLSMALAAPPEILYHGTSPKAADEIMLAGLQPMKRRYVHLSLDIPTAIEVAKRKSPQIAILQVFAGLAAGRGVRFYAGNERVRLADRIPSEFLQRIKVDVPRPSAG